MPHAISGKGNSLSLLFELSKGGFDSDTDADPDAKGYPDRNQAAQKSRSPRAQKPSKKESTFKSDEPRGGQWL